MRRSIVAALAVALLAAGCSSSADSSDGNATPTSRPASVKTQPPGTGTCDDADPSTCLFPWPNDRYTRADATTATGRRVDLPADSTPSNVDGKHIEPDEWNRNDGFSPSSILMTRVPDVDVATSKLPPVTDMARSLDPASSLVLVDVTTGERLAAWAELDANASDKTKQALMIVPAAGLPEGHVIAVGLRDLRSADGTAIDPSKVFAARVAEPDAQARVWLDALRDQDVKPGELTIAWSFTVGSGKDLSGRLRTMWSETSKALGDGAPKFTITKIGDNGPAKVIEGTFEMPRYLTGDGGPGSYLNNADDPNGIPTRRGTMTNDFLCLLPKSATADKPAPAVIYGHGLLGDRTEVNGLGTLGASVGVSFCALDYLGMSQSDIPTVVDSFKDLTAFRSMPDRLQQGHLGFLLLGRLLASDDGFVSNPEFQDADGKPLLNQEQISLLGASQGGILGGVASSLTDDWHRVILAVGGMGYNLLLRRSVDFDEFAPTIEANYPDELEQTLMLDLIEQLWQRGENTGYAQHLTRDPYPGTDAKTVLQFEAFGDHQVANVSTEKLARTLQIGRLAPTLTDGRSTDVSPFFGIDPIETLPTKDSALVVWDFGTPAPPTQNLPNRAGDDPHGKLGDETRALALVLGFIPTDGQIGDVCTGQPCTSPG